MRTRKTDSAVRCIERFIAGDGRLIPLGLRLAADDPVAVDNAFRFVPAGAPPKPTGRVRAIEAGAFAEGGIVRGGEEPPADDPLVRQHRGLFVEVTSDPPADAAEAEAVV